jgi:hypothetical protein
MNIFVFAHRLWFDGAYCRFVVLTAGASTSGPEDEAPFIAVTSSSGA